MARFNIEIAKHERMAPSGSALLKMIQNNSLPVLDLIVREAVQNSLDAAAPGYNHVNIDISIGKFGSTIFAYYFEGIKDKLISRFGKKECKYLAIRDSNTVGLTGKLHYSQNDGQEFGNLQKLIYEISKPQTGEGAGGSWGLGKTVYFRAGIGLVLYYSRIKDEEGNFASRMAATLVEDENSENALIDYPNPDEIKRGIAWWGKAFTTQPISTCPVTDESTIKNILDVLGISLYQGEQTGTTIIIPYIDEAKLLSGIVPEEDDTNSNHGGYYWMNSVDSYLNLAVQRWYTPRLSPKYKYGPYLKAAVNGRTVDTQKLAPVYQVLFDLYEMTACMKNTAPLSIVKDGIEYECKALQTQRILGSGGTVGYLAYAKVNESTLHMKAPDNNPNPYAFIGRYDIDRTGNPPLLTYTRKPGMFVNYATNGDWLDGVVPTVGENFIIALFVLNSENTVIGFSGNKLDEYVRRGEKSDHNNWFDWSFSDKQSYIISRIKSHTSKVLRERFKPNGNGPTTLTHSGLEKALADLLLPPDGFGRKATGGLNPPPPGKSKPGKIGVNPKMTIIDTVYTKSHVETKFVLATGKKQKNLLLELQVQTDSGAIHADGWEDPSTIGKNFPLYLISASFIGHENSEIVLSESGETPIALSEGVSAQIVCSERNRQPYAVKLIKTSEASENFVGSLTFSRTATDIVGIVSLTAKENS